MNSASIFFDSGMHRSPLPAYLNKKPVASGRIPSEAEIATFLTMALMQE